MSDPLTDLGLAAAVRELEAHAAESGWDQPARLFALVPTADLVRREPTLAAALGIEDGPVQGALTPIEQEVTDEQLERLLQTISWPGEVLGCAAVVERLVLPPGADEELLDDSASATSYARQHPDRQEVRIVAAITRSGASYCALRMRAHDDPDSVLSGPDLVPGLLELLAETLQEESTR